MTIKPSAPQGAQRDPPLRLAHVLFVLWVAGTVAWALFAARLAQDQGWWALRPDLAAVLVLAPPFLAHLLANAVIRLTGNPTFRS
ncbi:MAG: hypothetical protein ACR2PM_07655 [Hyphomicrobiales bacterium]